MESEQRLPSQQSSKSKKSPILVDAPLSHLHDDDDNTLQQHEQQQQQQPGPSRLRKVSDLAARRLSFMSFMSGMSGKSGKSSTDQDREKPKSASKSQAGRSSASHGSAEEAPPLSSPRSPEAPDRTNCGSPESEDNVGALPAFGISERGYLASLVSLFSTGHGDHDNLDSSSHSPLSSARTAITAPSIEDTNLGPHEYDVNSPAVYPYAKERRLYVGLPGIIHPPPEALLEFELETLPLLERDLHELSGHFGQRGIRITYELRMSGLASLKGDTVTLSPTVWILYRSYSSIGLQSCDLELRQAVSRIPYLQRGFEVQEGGGRIELAGDRRLVDVKVKTESTIQLSGGGALSVHIEDCDNKFSACGALCSVTIEEDDRRQMQSLCRIGGLILVNGKYILGVSTAHAMLDSSNIFKDSFDNSSEPRSLLGKAVDRDLIISEASGVSKWHDVTRDAAVDFLGVSMNSRGEMAINRSRPENATDFALLRLVQAPGDIRNQYLPPNSERPISITSSASASAASLDEGPVYILCGADQVVDGQLVWGSACYVVRGRNFHLRRIQTNRPLSKSSHLELSTVFYSSTDRHTFSTSGASAAGSWVVRGEVLYGVIIAVYDDEPFALMMTAERLFSSIVGSAFSIRSVELWDGVLPEAYRVHEEEQKAKAMARAKEKELRDRIKVEVRPLSNGSYAPPRKGKGGAGSFKDAARLNTVMERVETESEAGPSRAGAAVTPESPIASPKSYGLPHIETSNGLGIDEGATTGDSSFVTANEERPVHEDRVGMHARTFSHTSDTTMSGAVQSSLDKDEVMEHPEDIDIEDWHVKDWIPGVTDADEPGAKTDGHFDLKKGPPIRSTIQVAEVSSIITESRDGREDPGEAQEDRGRARKDQASTTAWQLKNALDRSMGESSSRGPSPPPKKRSGDIGPRLPPPETSKRPFFFRRRDSHKGKGNALDEAASGTSSRDEKRSSFLGRFSRKSAAEKEAGQKSKKK